MLSTLTYQEIIERGVTHWNDWRAQNPSHHPDLSGIKLAQAYLFGINLSGVNLKGADLHRACLIGADLSNADLSDADLSGAYLNEATLTSANLSNADLTNAQLFQADLNDATLDNAIVEGTCLASTIPAKVKVSDKEKDKPVVKAGNNAVDSNHVLGQPSQSRQSSGWRKRIKRQYRRALNFQQSFSRQAVPSAESETKNLDSESLPIPVHHSLVTDTHTTDITSDCLQKCHDALLEYYIAPVAKMLIDEVMTDQKPDTSQQLVAFVAKQVPSGQVEEFTHAVLG